MFVSNLTSVKPGRKIFQDFDCEHPSLWFATFELRLACWEIKSEKMRTDMLHAHFTEDSLVAVQDVIFSNATYARLKSKLLDRYEPTVSARVFKLLLPQWLGDRRPSEMLSYLKANVARDDISSNMLRELFISRMPEEIKLSLCMITEASLDQLAKAADRMMNNLTQTSTLPATEHIGIDLCKSNYNFAANNSALNAKLNSLESKVERLIQSTALSRHQHVDMSNRPIYRNFSYNNHSQNNNSEPQVHTSSTLPGHEDRRSAPKPLCFYHR